MNRRTVVSTASFVFTSFLAGCSQSSSSDSETDIREQILTKGSSLKIGGVTVSATDFELKEQISTIDQNQNYSPPEGMKFFMSNIQFENRSSSGYELPPVSEFKLNYNGESLDHADITGVIDIYESYENDQSYNTIGGSTIEPNQTVSAWVIHLIEDEYNINSLSLSFLFDRDDTRAGVRWTISENSIEGKPENKSDERLIAYDPITDLLPAVNEFPDNDVWEKNNVDTNPDTELHTDVQTVYKGNFVDEEVTLIISIAGYDSIELAQERYSKSASFADSENIFEDSMDESVDEGHISKYDDFTAIVWRDMNIVYKIETNKEPISGSFPDLLNDMRTLVQDTWQTQFM